MADLTSTKRSRLKLILWAAFSSLTALALIVIFFLPSHVANPRKAPAIISVERPAVAAIPNSKNSAAKTLEIDKPAADKLLSEALRRLARLESEGARIWGKEMLKTTLPTAEEALKKANILYDRQQYTPSLKFFQEAIAALDQLAASRPERFQRAMNRGKKAFGALDAMTAIAQFQIAVAITPGSEQGSKALERARNLPEVLSNIARGQEHEGARDIDHARVNYLAAVALDPAYIPANSHLARIEKVIADRDYKRAVSAALVRLDKQDFKGAAGALQRAGRICPNTPEVKDIAKRIAAAVQFSTLDTLRKTAMAFEEQEKWPEALGLYKKALAIDKNAAFADRGRRRAQGLMELHSAIDRYLSEPMRLQSSGPLAHAKGLLAQSGPANAVGRTLQTKRKRLQDLIFLAEKPIPVLFRSDQRTEITVYRAGSFGSFKTRRIELRPGNYTAAGSRPGYRDVRVQFRVSPSRMDTTITIQCTEQIKQ
jgi:tetratricopeptide (TPR) repeat protein